MSLDVCKACGKVTFSAQFCSYCLEMHEELRCWSKKEVSLMRYSKNKKLKNGPSEGKIRSELSEKSSKVEDIAALKGVAGLKQKAMPESKGFKGSLSLLQGTCGHRGNFELVVPVGEGGLAHLWRDNDDQELRWNGPSTFGMKCGHVESVSLIQSNFGMPGHLEIAAISDGQLLTFWRDSGPDFRWNGPQYLTY